MKILHLNYKDIQGGAARAAYRLHKSLQGEVESKMLVRQKYSNDKTVDQINPFFPTQLEELRRGLDSLPVRQYRNRSETYFSPCIVPDNVNSIIEKMDPDVVHLHWIGGGYMSIDSVSDIDYPTVWTLHDMWAFTGGCHYAGECRKYTQTCGECPVLNSDKRGDLSRRVWERKNKNWESFDPIIITPSSWLSECVESSSLFENKTIQTIPNPIPIKKYQPQPRQRARDMFDLNHDKNIFLYGAMDATSDPRKGYKYIENLIDIIPKNKTDSVEFVVFGSDSHKIDKRNNIRINHLGFVKDSNLPALYSAVDAMIVPSKQDNLPNTILESLACGTPCIAFDVGGISDVIQDKQTGYLAEPYNPADLLSGLEWVMSTEYDSQFTKKRCREYVIENCSPNVVCEQYMSEYLDIVGDIHPH